MKKLLAKIRKLLRDRRTRRIITRFVSITAAIVVFITTYALVLPAITMESEAYCGIPTHQHDDSCFTEELVCGEVESPGHVHTESCYTVTPVLACTEEVHTHGENCYGEDGELVCEVPEHQHDDDCFAEERVLTCEIPESEGHQHTADCYEKVLTCGKEVHVHSTACYEEPAPDVSDTAVVASTASTGSTASAAGASTGAVSSVDEYGFENPGENAGESAGSGEAEDASSALTAADEAAAGNTDAPGSTGAAGIDANATTGSTNAAESITGEAGITADGEYVPQLEPLNFPAVLSPSTGIYYHPVADGEVIEDSTQIANDGWNRIPGNEEHGDKVELGKNDLLRVYLSYAIPAGNLNTTNPVARYRLPGNLHLTDSQLNAINANVNGIAGQYISYDTLEITDTEKYYAYLGVEAVEGIRTPDQDAAEYARELARRTGDGSEYISAVVRVENVYSELTGEYLGQDLVFTFTPYSIGKNQHEYDRTGQPTKAGEAIEGWLTLDFNTSQVDWNEPAVTTFEREEEVATAEDQTVDDETGEATEAVETVQRSEQTSEIVFVAEGIDENGNRIHEISTELTVVEETVVETKDAVNDATVDNQSDENSGEGTTEDVAAATTEEAAVEDQEKSDQEQSDESNTGETADTADSAETSEQTNAEAEAEEQYQDGTLTATGDGYRITLDYTAEAQIPESAHLNVTDITEASDKEAYEACLEAARQSISQNAADGGNQTVDKSATRFFDIEIVAEETATTASEDLTVASEETADDTLVEETADNDSTEDTATVDETDVESDAEVDDIDSTKGEESATGETEEESESTTGGFRKIEPAAPVSVRIELFDTVSRTADGADSHSVDNEKSENDLNSENTPSDPTVLHFTEDGLETIESTMVDAGAVETTVDDNMNGQNQNSQSQGKAGAEDGVTDGTQTIQFEASSFSIYGVVYTTLSTTVLTASGETYEITVTYDGEAGIPDDAVLEAEEILEGTAAYEDYLAKTVEALSDKQSDNQKVLGDSKVSEDSDEDIDDAEVTTENDENAAVVDDSVQVENGEEPEDTEGHETTIVAEEAETPRVGFARFFDIRIMSNGQKIEPKTPVKVTISYEDAVKVDEGEELLAVHFADDGTEIIATEADDKLQEIAFIQGSFSVTGTVVTSGQNWPSSSGQYVMYFSNYGNNYAIKHDGTATPVTVSGGSLTFASAAAVADISDYLWTYDNSNYNNTVSYTAGGQTQYLDPQNSNGISSTWRALSRGYSGSIYTSEWVSGGYGGYGYTQYYNINWNGNNRITGRDNYNSVNIQFANAFAVDVPPTVTVHYVDRAGGSITGVTYSGSNSTVIDNGDGTFSIPISNASNIDLKNDFDYSNINNVVYTYANTHLAGKDGNGDDLTYNGLTIESTLKSKSGILNISTDLGEVDGTGNVGYNPLKDYSLSGSINARPTNNGSVITYAARGSKDIYVVLDPISENSSGTVPAASDLNPDLPTLDKTMEDNEDGTYTLSLKVEGHRASATKTGRANVLLIVDTSSSMRAPTTNGVDRITDTHDAVKNLGKLLLSHNTPDENDKVQVSMIAFDGGVSERLDWTNSSADFETAVDDYIKYYYMHRGTDWEDAAKGALDKISTADDDPTFVIFFTDGEPSQYSSFHGAGTYNGNTTYPYTEIATSYNNFYSYFLSREASKDEMRAIVNAGTILYGIYAYNKPTATYFYNDEDGAKLLHNAIKYGYNTTADLSDQLFYQAEDTDDLNDAFDKILNSIIETVGFTNVTVHDGIATGVTSSTVVGGDVTGFTYIIKDETGALDYQVSVGADGVPTFTLSDGTKHTGEKRPVSTKKIKTDAAGNPITDGSGNIQTENRNIEVYYYKDSDNVEYIMPIATAGENVTWDLSPLGILKDGYTYDLQFVVWPKQDAYDLVAKLNNGIKDGITEDWSSKPVLTDSDGNEYRIGGIQQHPYIARYENGTYAAMSNTNQTMDYYKADEKAVNGQITTVYQGPTHVSVDPPDPMDLSDNHMKVQKVWQVSRLEELVAFLYNTSDGTVLDENKNIVLKVLQDGSTTPYFSVTLGYDETTHTFAWVGDTEDVVVKDQNKEDIHYTIGTAWEKELNISIGLMITPDKAAEHSINTVNNTSIVPVYAEDDESRSNVLYYVLERGHDYTIDEAVTDYRFDFTTDIYHPMLVNKDLKDVKIEYKAEGGRTIGILKYITPNGKKLSALSGTNVLRGELKMKKIVLDAAGNEDNSDEANAKVFPLTITLTNDPGDGSRGPFYNTPGVAAEQNVPWYGIQTEDDETTLYYHRVDSEGKFLYYCNEHTACIGGNYINGIDEDNGYRGNMMTASNNCTVATATIYVKPKETWTITNIPGGTDYTITETQIEGYEFIKAEEVGASPANKVEKPDPASIDGEIEANKVTNVEFTNKIKPPVFIKKVSADNSSITADGAEFDLYREYENQDLTEESMQELNDTEHLNLVLKFGKYLQKVNASKIVSGTYQLEDDVNDETDETVHGYVMMGNLSTGDTFYLVETKAPDGYNSPVFDYIKLTFGTTVDPPGSETTKAVINWLAYVENTETHVYETTGTAGRAFVGTIATDHEDGTIDAYTVTVANNPGAELPSTGGPGTRLIYILGGMMTAAAGLLLLHRRKRIMA